MGAFFDFRHLGLTGLQRRSSLHPKQANQEDERDGSSWLNGTHRKGKISLR
jgi:hypothetical protein